MPATLSYARNVGIATVADVDLVIDLHSKEPAYIQLARRIRAVIDAGEIAPRDPIPSYKQLMEATGLAMGTVQKAIRLLEREHYVYTVSGRGTFVTPRNTEAP
jgi:DNA-binding GntR family transcriptional regulator